MAEESKDYVVYGMRAKCSEGTMENYISTDVGHGVVYQGQPLLNANDHTKQINLTHFGDCNSKKIYEDAKKQIDEKYKADANDGFFSKAFKWYAKTAAKIAITAKEYLTFHKCELDTPLPWMFCNEEHMIDGAPALTMESQCPCRFGGVITIVPIVEEAAEGETIGEESVEGTGVAGNSAMLAAGVAAAKAVGQKSAAAQGGIGVALGAKAKGAFSRTGIGKKGIGEIMQGLEISPNGQLVNERTLGEINSQWSENMDAFKELYGENVLREIGQSLYEYGVTDETSVMMFLSMIGTETKYGLCIGEEKNGLSDRTYQSNRDKSGIPIISSDVGVGLAQVTGDSQQYFIRDLYLSSNSQAEKSRIENYFGVSGDYFENLKSYEAPELENAAGFIYEYYPIESAAWYWGGTDMKCATFDGNGNQNNYSINDYIVNYSNNGANMDNVFLSTQYALNGRRNFSKENLDNICKCPTAVWSEGNSSVTINGKTSLVPNGWESRNEDWQNAKGLIADE